MNNENIVDVSQPMLQKNNMSLTNEPQENEVLLEQRFICLQEGQEVCLCQMQECIITMSYSDPYQI